jgi:hypothetical protein
MDEFNNSMKESLNIIQILAILIGCEVFMITFLTYMNHMFESKNVTCRGCLLVKKLKKRKIKDIDTTHVTSPL